MIKSMVNGASPEPWKCDWVSANEECELKFFQILRMDFGRDTIRITEREMQELFPSRNHLEATLATMKVLFARNRTWLTLDCSIWVV